MQVEARLEELRLVLPEPAKPLPGIGDYPSRRCWYVPTEPTSTVL